MKRILTELAFALALAIFTLFVGAPLPVALAGFCDRTFLLGSARIAPRFARTASAR
jgi:hypothetical protein